MISTIALSLCILLFFVFLVWLSEDTQRYHQRRSRMLNGAPIQRVVLESPFRPVGETDEEIAFSALMNRLYLRLALYDSLSRGEAPFASHAIYTQALNDAVEDERERGIKSGFAWGECASKVVAYEDLGLTPGMIRGITFAEGEDIAVERRQMFKDQSQILAFYDLAATLVDNPNQEEPNGKEIHDFIQEYAERFNEYTGAVESAIFDVGHEMGFFDQATDDILPEEEAKIALYDAFVSLTEKTQSSERLAQRLRDIRDRVNPVKPSNAEKEDTSC
jgi:hypothetical protein